MKKRIILVSTCIIVLLIGLVFINNKSKKTFKQDGITYALTLDGTSTNSFPTKGLYQVSATCTNATGKWDYDVWKLYVENIMGDVTCDIAFNTITKTYLNNRIIGLSGTKQGTGQIVHEKFTDASGSEVDTGYRYEGKDPNNYVWFNNELWRIIGVFDTDTHGQSDNTSTTVKENQLVKIIREKSIGGLVWDKSSKNDWSISSLKSLLNGAYYNAQNGTGGEYCYGYLSSTSANCDYTQIGIQSNYRGMIKNVTWHLGSGSGTAESLYGYERGEKKYGSNPTTITGYIGLMYLSDYGYSVLASTDCPRTKGLISYYNSACAGQSWLYGEGYEWSITPSSSCSNEAFRVDGGITNNRVGTGYAVRPTLYLDSSVYVLDGDGSYNNPYIIGM